MSLEPLDNMEKPKGSFPLVALGVIFLLLASLAGLFMVLYEREKPQVVLLNDVSRFGLAKEVGMAAIDDKSGVSFLEVVIKQDGKSSSVFKRDYPRQGYLYGAGPQRAEESFVVSGRNLGLRDGVAEMVVTVRDYSWWSWMAGNESIATYPIVLDTRPPRVSIKESPRYIKSGSAGVVIYKVSEPIDKHGVVVNETFHPGFPIPRYGEGVYGALIGLAHDLSRVEKSYVTAMDLAGNEGKGAFGMILRKKPLKRDRINVSQGFLSAKLPEFALHYPELAGTPVEQYIQVNNEVRRENYAKVLDICSTSQPERLWDGRFLRMRRSSRRANYADHRTYYFDNQKIDQQVHLGIDLASVRHADIEAANRGVVIFADYLGIYGHTVILDHGQGLFSLYSHMSQIDVTVGDMIDKGGLLGLSGKSGMAGGDHLHLSILVNGIFVNPEEWWDEGWVKLNFLNFL